MSINLFFRACSEYAQHRSHLIICCSVGVGSTSMCVTKQRVELRSQERVCEQRTLKAAT